MATTNERFVLEISSLATSHIVRAIDAEVLHLKAVHQECGDNWPDDFDPNDIPLYLRMREFFSADPVVIERPGSKSVAFTMALIPPYVALHRERLSIAEVAELFRAYVQFVVKVAAPYIARGERLPANFQEKFAAILNFEIQ